jgi:hypothetical protein
MRQCVMCVPATQKIFPAGNFSLEIRVNPPYLFSTKFPLWSETSSFRKIAGMNQKNSTPRQFDFATLPSALNGKTRFRLRGSRRRFAFTPPEHCTISFAKCSNTAI